MLPNKIDNPRWGSKVELYRLLLAVGWLTLLLTGCAEQDGQVVDPAQGAMPPQAGQVTPELMPTPMLPEPTPDPMMIENVGPVELRERRYPIGSAYGEVRPVLPEESFTQAPAMGPSWEQMNPGEEVVMIFKKELSDWENTLTVSWDGENYRVVLNGIDDQGVPFTQEYPYSVLGPQFIIRSKDDAFRRMIIQIDESLLFGHPDVRPKIE